jgi:hypothetical protein
MRVSLEEGLERIHALTYPAFEVMASNNSVAIPRSAQVEIIDVEWRKETLVYS